jgi:hypothetical protein
MPRSRQLTRKAVPPGRFGDSESQLRVAIGCAGFKFNLKGWGTGRGGVGGERWAKLEHSRFQPQSLVASNTSFRPDGTIATFGIEGTRVAWCMRAVQVADSSSWSESS